MSPRIDLPATAEVLDRVVSGPPLYLDRKDAVTFLVLVVVLLIAAIYCRGHD